MAQFTTTINTIVNNLCDDRLAPLNERIESARSKIFDFQYSLPTKQYYTEDFKQYFETAFINHYLFDEIGSETVARFKQRVNAKLLDIIPKYYLMFETLNNVDFNSLLKNSDIENITNNTTQSNGTNEITETHNTHYEGKSGNKSAGASLPENILSDGQIGNFTNVGYADSGVISRTDDENETTINRNSKNTSDNNSTNNGTSKTIGRNIMQFDFLRAMNGDFNNFFNNFINEFKPLFMLIFY